MDAFGYASRTWNIPTTAETRFDTASITKLFTAVATLQLVEQGAFALDTSVIGYLGAERTGISPAVTPYHLRALRGPLPRAAEQLSHRDG